MTQRRERRGRPGTAAAIRRATATICSSRRREHALCVFDALHAFGGSPWAVSRPTHSYDDVASSRVPHRGVKGSFLVFARVGQRFAAPSDFSGKHAQTRASSGSGWPTAVEPGATIDGAAARGVPWRRLCRRPRRSLRVMVSLPPRIQHGYSRAEPVAATRNFSMRLSAIGSADNTLHPSLRWSET